MPGEAVLEVRGLTKRYEGLLALDRVDFDVGRGVTLCYEGFGDPDDTPILLIMGLATQMIAWNEDFCEALAERGYALVQEFLPGR